MGWPRVWQGMRFGVGRAGGLVCSRTGSAAAGAVGIVSCSAGKEATSNVSLWRSEKLAEFLCT